MTQAIAYVGADTPRGQRLIERRVQLSTTIGGLRRSNRARTDRASSTEGVQRRVGLASSSRLRARARPMMRRGGAAIERRESEAPWNEPVLWRGHRLTIRWRTSVPWSTSTYCHSRRETLRLFDRFLCKRRIEELSRVEDRARRGSPSVLASVNPSRSHNHLLGIIELTSSTRRGRPGAHRARPPCRIRPRRIRHGGRPPCVSVRPRLGEEVCSTPPGTWLWLRRGSTLPRTEEANLDHLIYRLMRATRYADCTESGRTDAVVAGWSGRMSTSTRARLCSSVSSNEVLAKVQARSKALRIRGAR